MLHLLISSRLFSSGFDISTPHGAFSTNKRFLSDECLIFDPSGNQIARVGPGSFVSSVYNIIITGGGFYEFGREKKGRRTWICKGEGKLFSMSEQSKRRFTLSDGTQQIAECKRAWWTGDYAINVLNDADLKLVVCIYIALSLSEHVVSGGPID